jgi:hypothetical protein
MKRFLVPFFAVVVFAFASSGHAQSLGTFRWQLQPFGSVLNLSVTQSGAIYIMNGFEAQCGGNLSLPVWGVAVPQANGTVMIGLTTITELGSGLHTQARISMTTFNGTWSDNGNQSGNFAFNPGVTCPGGPRIAPIHPDMADAQPPAASADQFLTAMKQKLAELQAKQ